MKGYTLSKQCIFVGAFGFALSCAAFLNESRTWKFHSELVNLDYPDNYEPSPNRRARFVKHSAILMAEYAAAAIFSILLIWGVVKRRLALMAPWLLAAFALVGYCIYSAIYDISEAFGHVELLLLAVGVAGVQTLILYPLCSLFREIYHEKSEERKQQPEGGLSNLEKNTNFGFVHIPSK